MAVVLLVIWKSYYDNRAQRTVHNIILICSSLNNNKLLKIVNEENLAEFGTYISMKKLNIYFNL